MKRRGSALVVAIFIITLVGSVTFGMGRLIFLETDTTITYESGTIAYYAAESGIEEAFLRYRYNQDTQMPVFVSDWSLPENQNQFVRNDLTSKDNISLAIDAADNNINPQNQVYDLRVGSSARNFGSLSGVTCSKTTDTNCIQRDEAKKFSVDFSDLDNNDVSLSFLPKSGTASPTGFFAGEDKESCVLLEVKIIGREDAYPINERKKMFYNPACDYGSMISTTDKSTQPYDFVDGSFTTGNLKNWVWPTKSLVESELLIRPIGATVAFTLSKVGSGWFYGATTQIDSRGYYGGIGKKLTASIDRQSGTLYDLFDYVIYKAE